MFYSYLSTMMEYWGISVTWALIEMVGLFSALFLWFAVYASNKTVGNYSFGQMIFYYAFIPLVGSLTEVYIISSLPKMIKDGRISTDLLKPYKISVCFFIRTISLKVAQQVLKLPFFLIMLAGIFLYFGLIINLSNVILCLLFCPFALFFNYLVDLCLSYTAFWIDDVWALKHLKIVLLLVFGGMAFPVDLVPTGLKSIFLFLPFKFVYYVPISIVQGISLDALFSNLVQIICWIAIFGVMAKLLWRAGIKKYGAYGN